MDTKDDDIDYDSLEEPEPSQDTATHCHYSCDLKECIIYQHQKLNMKPAEISLSLDMSLCVVQRTLQLYYELGEVN
ncbi:hypothetical protein K439DRAFT_1357339 [Ramaria rubella]|nr:hypothetical protein K439DRAFT_1357339 [Ramaria rubella]